MSSNKILVLGSAGLIGGALLKFLQEQGFEARGADRAVLDTADDAAVAAFPWLQYSDVFDCTGRIDYRDDQEVREKLRQVNVCSPLNILNHLGKGQHYFYLSSHAVLREKVSQNPYVRSKAEFEERALQKPAPATVTILRLPGIFADERQSGLLYKIKESFSKRQAIKLSLNTNFWHAMYLPRLTSILTSFLLSGPKENLITVGYPLETGIELVLKSAEKSFGYSVPIEMTESLSDHYVPDISQQEKYVRITGEMFEEDLKTYFKT